MNDNSNTTIFRMAGTEKTFEYQVVAATALGRVGIRGLGYRSRIRVEPVGDLLLDGMSRADGWKQPGDSNQPRYSKVVGSDQLYDTVATALVAIDAGILPTVSDDETPEWVRRIVETAEGDTVTIRVLRESSIQYFQVVDHPVATLNDGVNDDAELRALNMGDLVILDATTGSIGIRSRELRATRQHIELESESTRRSYAEVPELALSLNTLWAEYGHVQTTVNGEPRTLCANLEPGDAVEITIPGGEAEEADFDQWAAEMRAEAEEALEVLTSQRAEAVAARRAQLNEMNYFRGLRAEALNRGVKWFGVAASDVVDGILDAEFPAIDEEEFANAWLADEAPEVLEH